jgi:hypothetical protein
MMHSLSAETESTLSALAKESQGVQSAIGDVACGLVQFACRTVPLVCLPRACLPLKAACALANHWFGFSTEGAASMGSSVLSSGDLDKYCRAYKAGWPVLERIKKNLPVILRQVVGVLMDAADAICGIDEVAAVSASCGCARVE